MHDNPQAAPGLAFALSGHRVIELKGPDAAAFAHAQFMNDVKVIAPGEWQWSGWLTSKGRVIALFALLKLDEQMLYLVVPDADQIALSAGLRRFVFRSKVAIEVRDDLQAEGRFCAPVQARGHALAVDDAGNIELDQGSGPAARTLRLTRASAAVVDAQAEARWAMHDLEHGLPRLPASQVEHWTPQQLSLERLRAFSVKKGCYPGQEIVARTHFLGKAKRGLILVDSLVPMAVGTELRSAEVALGNVVATADADGRHLALVVGPLERGSSALAINGLPVREAPLLEGLAR